jgi:hypothetical protein
VPVVYVRHVSLPPSHLGVAALRTAMAWQRRDRAEDVTAAFPPDAEHTQVTAALAPVDGEPVFDKLGMSALVGTPVEALLRDRGVTTLVLVGAVLEIGIEPTARHAADLGFLPVVVDDACGVSTRTPRGARWRPWTTACSPPLHADEVVAAFAAADPGAGDGAGVRATEDGEPPASPTGGPPMTAPSRPLPPTASVVVIGGGVTGWPPLRAGPRRACATSSCSTGTRSAPGPRARRPAGCGRCSPTR